MSSDMASLTAIDLDLGEAYYKGDEELEKRHTDEIIDSIKRFLDESFREGMCPVRRDAHAFDNGCVRAVFRVDEDLDAALTRGVFVPGREYPAWIRFSNGNCVEKSQRFPDARGMAIKLLNVPGPKMMEDEKHTQDFILISHPRFFVNDPVRYRATLEPFFKGDIWNQFVRSPLHLGSARAIVIALFVNVKFVSNPLFIQYWSMTPSRLGVEPGRKMAVKYTAKPRAAGKPGFLGRAASYFAPGFSLKKAMNKRLAEGEATFDFYVQRHVDQRTPIEDSTVEWRESVSKPEHVATIVIPSQSIMSAEQASFCDNLSYSPWHGLAEHKPLGLVNRVRRKTYHSISEYRHALNKVPPREPTGSETFPPG